jgi:hypothetical protein
MNKLYIFLLILFLNSCGSLKEANKILRNEKIKTTDEFLIEKREPLVYPPNYEKIPEPGSNTKKETSEEEKIKKILKLPEQTKTKKNKSSSIEDTILKEIRK